MSDIKLTTDATGATFYAPPAVAAGEGAPPYSMSQSVQIAADEAGHRWIVLQWSDGTITTTVRFAWQHALPALASMGQAVQQAVDRIQAEQGPTLLRPGMPAFDQLSDLAKRHQNGNGHAPR